MSGWLIVNVAMPLLLPVLGIIFLWPLPLEARYKARLKLIATVKDGQLCWGVVGLCAALMYELWTYLHYEKHPANWQTPDWSGWVFGVTTFLMLGAMILAATGAVFSTELNQQSGSGAKAWLKHYTTFAVSAVMSAAVAILYSVVHYAMKL